MDLAITRLTERITKGSLMRNILSGHIPVLIISLLFIVPLTDSSKMFNGIVSAKKYYFYLFMLIMIVYNMVLFIVEKRYNHISLNKIDIAFLLYAGWNLFSAIITNDSYINDKTGELVMLVAYYFIIKMYLENTDRYVTFLNITSTALLTVGIIESVVGLLQVYELIPSRSMYFRVTGTFYNPAQYALLLSVIFSFSLAISIFHQGFHVLIRYLSYITCFLILNVITFTYNRASWIGIAAGILLVLFYYLYTKGFIARISRLIKAGILFLIFIFGIAGLILLYNLKKDSSRGRLLILKVSSNMVKDHPVTGIGYGRFRSEYNLYQADYFRENKNPSEMILAGDTRLAFNEYIETLAETGLIGFIFYGYLIFKTLFPLNRMSYFSPIVKLPVIVILILSFISYPINSQSSKILFIFFLILISSGYDGQKFFVNRSLTKSAFGVFSICCFLILWIFLRKYSNYDVLNAGAYAFYDENYNVAETYFRKIEKSMNSDPTFSLYFAESLNYNEKRDEALRLYTRVRNIEPNDQIYLLLGKFFETESNIALAQKCYEEASFMVPGKITPKYYLAKLYYCDNNTHKADSLVEELLKMDIKVTSDSTFKMLKELKTLYMEK